MQRADKNKITRRSISALRSFEKSRFSTPFSLSCLRTGPLAPFAPNDGFRRLLRSARLGTRLAGRRGVILNEKGASARLSAREASHRSDTHLRVQSPLLFQAFPRTFLLLLCLFRQSESRAHTRLFLVCRKPLARRVVQKKTDVDNGKRKTPFAILEVRSANCTSKQREVIQK